MATFKTPIKYTNREFDSIKSDLVQYAKRYYPEIYRDFNQASFGSLMLDTVAYIGDVLSFYLDYQVNESFLDSAAEFSNVVRLSKQLGYKYRGVPSATGIAAFFCIVPAADTGLGPNTTYLPILKAGTSVSSKGGNKYTLDEDVRFDDPNNEVVVARVNDSNGLPTSYAIKGYGRIVAGGFARERKAVGRYRKFRKVPLASKRLSEIVSVIDEEGHEYFEVDYLSQNVIYRSITNTGTDKDSVSAIMKPFVVPRRFIVEREKGKYYLQFGYGSDSELASASVAEPSNISLKMHGRQFISDTSFDPTKLLETDKFGVAPANTTLTITYRESTRRNSNAKIGRINQVNQPILDYVDPTQVPASVKTSIRTSIEVYNEEQIVGSVSVPSTKELKRRAYDFFATQNRAVTAQDFEAIAYGMPAKFGTVKRIKIVQDQDSFKRNLNMYVLSQDRNRFLTIANNTLKENLKMWLSNYKMIHDTVDILDGKIVNFGIEFYVVANPEFNKFQVLSQAQNAIAAKYNEPLFMGEALYVTDIINTLNKEVPGILDVKSVKIIPRNGGTYSDTTFDFISQLSGDGRRLLVPDNVCMELKYPDRDIRGTVE